MFTIPVLNIKADPLDALLAAVGYRLSMLAGGDNEAFKALIADRDVTIQLGADSAGITRSYHFKNGSFSQKSGAAEKPTLSIDFKDSATGIKLLTGGDASAFMTAIQAGELKMDGDYSLLMWFNKLAKHIVPAIPEEYKPYIQKAKPYAYKAQQFAKHWIGVAKHKLAK